MIYADIYGAFSFARKIKVMTMRNQIIF